MRAAWLCALVVAAPHWARAEAPAWCAVSDRLCSDARRVRITVEAPRMSRLAARAAADRIRPCFPVVGAWIADPGARIEVTTDASGATRSARLAGPGQVDGYSLAHGAMMAVLDARCAVRPHAAPDGQPTTLILRFEPCCAEAPIGGF